jgi:hypothetical protein
VEVSKDPDPDLLQIVTDTEHCQQLRSQINGFNADLDPDPPPWLEYPVPDFWLSEASLRATVLRYETANNNFRQQAEMEIITEDEYPIPTNCKGRKSLSLIHFTTT